MLPLNSFVEITDISFPLMHYSSYIDIYCYNSLKYSKDFNVLNPFNPCMYFSSLKSILSLYAYISPLNSFWQCMYISALNTFIKIMEICSSNSLQTFMDNLQF